MASGTQGLQRFVQALEDFGLTDVMLPFLLVFTIIFAVLQKSHILGEGKKNLNVIVALVMALSVVIPHVTHSYPTAFDPVNVMNQALPAVSIVAVAIISLLILIGLFGQEKIFLGVSLPGWITFIAFMTILAIFGSAAGWFASGFNPWLEDFFGSDVIGLIIMLLVFGIIITFITSEGKEEEGAFKKLGFDFGKLFGGGGGHH